jgi:cell division initiation protein
LRLTPLDIKKQEFKRTLRGYDPMEVDAFLEMVADEYEATLREKNRLSDEVVQLRTQLRDYQEVEKTLKRTLMTAEQTIAESRENSRREAEMIVREAELKAERILDSAKKRLAELKNELQIIRAQKASFARRLRHLLESQLELIGVLGMDDVGYGEEEEESQAAAKGTQQEASTEEAKSGEEPSSAALRRNQIKTVRTEEKEGDAVPEKRSSTSDQFIT